MSYGGRRPPHYADRRPHGGERRHGAAPFRDDRKRPLPQPQRSADGGGPKRQRQELPAAMAGRAPEILRRSASSAGVVVDDRETDPRRLQQREKQISYGKNTIGYDRYTTAVPRHRRTRQHPRTPDVHKKMSKRAWEGLIRKWRRDLHAWDDGGSAGPPAAPGGRPGGEGRDEGEEKEQKPPRNARSAGDGAKSGGAGEGAPAAGPQGDASFWRSLSDYDLL